MKRFAFVVALIAAVSATLPAYATRECIVHVRVLHRGSKKAYRHLTILVHSIGTEYKAVTDTAGNCILEFNTCDSCDPKDKSGHITFLARKTNGAVVVLASFHNFPKSFRPLDDQEFETTFFL